MEALCVNIYVNISTYAFFVLAMDVGPRKVELLKLPHEICGNEANRTRYGAGLLSKDSKNRPAVRANLSDHVYCFEPAEAQLPSGTG